MKRAKTIVSSPIQFTKLVSIDKDLNWTFDRSVDPHTIFSKLSVIGKGGFGTVFQIVHLPSMRLLAGKLINPTLFDDNSRKEIEHEIQMMREVITPYTVRYFGSVLFEGSVMILMEYVDRGSFRDLMDERKKVLSEDQLSIVMLDLLTAIKTIHDKHRIVHRDIKAANILLNSDAKVKVADFGVSRQFDTGVCQTMAIVGTPYWMAPEVITGINYSFPADIWSIGITAVELAEGAPPYIEFTPAKAMIEIAIKGFPGYRFPEYHSAEFMNFVSHCVEIDPALRWTPKQLLKHPYINRAKYLNRKEVLKELVVTVIPKLVVNNSLLASKSEPIFNISSAATTNSNKGNAQPNTSSKSPAATNTNNNNIRHSVNFGTFVASSEISDSSYGTFVASKDNKLGTFATSENTAESTFASSECTAEPNSPALNPDFTKTFVSTFVDRSVAINEEEAVKAQIFIDRSHAMSAKTKFTPFELAGNNEAEATQIYKTTKCALPSQLFRTDGVVDIRAVMQHPKAPKISAVGISLASLYMFGPKGIFFLVTVSLFCYFMNFFVNKKN